MPIDISNWGIKRQKESRYVKAGSRIRNWPLIKGFIAKYPSSSTRNIEIFYDNYSAAEKVYNRFSELKSHEPEKAEQFLIEHQNENRRIPDNEKNQ